MIVVSVGQSHGLREQSMPGALCDILLMVDVVAHVVLNEKLEGGPADGLLLGGVCAAVVRSVLFIAGGHDKYNC
jgi:hypothetical protein